MNPGKTGSHELLRDCIDYGGLICLFSVKIEPCRNDGNKELSIPNRLLEEWKNFSLEPKIGKPLIVALKSGHKEELDFERSSVLNQHDKNFDDILYGLLGRKLTYFTKTERSKMYFVKIADEPHLIHNEQVEKVRVRVYLLLKKRPSEMAADSTSFSPIVGVLADISVAHESEDRKNGTEVFLKLTSVGIDDPTSMVHDGELQGIMLRKLQEFLTGTCGEKSYVVAQEVDKMYRTCIISTSFFQEFVHSTPQGRTNWSVQGDKDKFTNLAYYIVNLLRYLPWDEASLSNRNRILEREFSDYLGPRANVTKVDHWTASYFAPGSSVFLLDSERFGEAISGLHSLAEEDRDYSIASPRSIATWEALQYSMISAVECVFQDYLREVSSTEVQGSLIDRLSKLMAQALVDFEDYYNMEILSGAGKGEFRDEFEVQKKINLVTDSYILLKEKMALYGSYRVYKEQAQILEKQREILEKQHQAIEAMDANVKVMNCNITTMNTNIATTNTNVATMNTNIAAMSTNVTTVNDSTRELSHSTRWLLFSTIALVAITVITAYILWASHH